MTGARQISAFSEADAAFSRRALELAARGAGRVSPNPMVGAVLVREGAVLAEGFHRAPGEAHAEIDALRQLDQPDAARGATLYVNLEPCAHQGRTPPCADRLVEEGIARVVACHADPDPQVAGRGFERLRAAGIAVQLAPPSLCREAVLLNLPFLVSRTERRAAVTLKWAMSLDGKIATHQGESQWISSPEGRQWALALREEHDAIAVGSNTALVDDPRLTRRLSQDGAPITRVVLDRRLRLPLSAALLRQPGPVLVYSEAGDAPWFDERAAGLREAGAEVVALTRATPLAVAQDLASRGLNSLLLEGGGEVLEAFASSRCFDRVALCAAALLIGGRDAAPAIGGRGVGALSGAARLESLSCVQRGPDLVITGLARGRAASLLDAVSAVVEGS